ncbi:hypothetical protein SAY87_009455 [Trapa incisa]|uniref:RING-type E3 ubiquitin transferase n=1 Tax=Trapa incisa TaxID=236973 RepID=A0AAN7JVP3_9MYRT|nr:hypothetical protein SAY87_009455 [Trapa incisa]
MVRRSGDKKEDNVAVAIDKDKGSQYALKWAVDNLLSRGQKLTLLHVKTKSSPSPSMQNMDMNEDASRAYKQQLENQAKELFLPFRCFCTRKEIQCNEVIIEETDVARAIIDYVNTNVITAIVLGAPTKSGIFRHVEDVSSVSGAGVSYQRQRVFVSRGKRGACHVRFPHCSSKMANTKRKWQLLF